jgi:hypothetical protein
MKSRWSLVVIAVAAALMLASGTGAVGQTPPVTCNLPGPVCNFLSAGVPDPECPKLPTTLPITNGGVTNGPGFYNNGTPCGVNTSTKKTCGANLGLDACNAESVGYGWPCDIDPDYPLCLGGGTGGGPCDDSPSGDCSDGASPPVMIRPAAAVVTRLEGIGLQALQPSTENALNALGGLRSLHLVASAVVTMRDPAAANATPMRWAADYEYWESGRAYRIRNTLDPKAGLVDVPEWAFDGRYLQTLLGSAEANSALSVRRGDERATMVPLENPLFLALAFLSPEDADSCPACELRLADLGYLARLRATVADTSGRRGVAAATSDPALVVPAGRSYNEGHPSTSHQLTQDANGRVVSIKQVDAAGHLLRQIDLADFRTAEGLGVELPRTVTVSKSNVGEGLPWLVVRYEIGTIEVNKSIPAATYNLMSLARVHKIWDSDLNVYVKHERVAGDAVCPKNADPK